MRLGRSRYPNVELRINAMTLSPVRLPAFGPWQESPWRSVGYLRVGTGPASHFFYGLSSLNASSPPIPKDAIYCPSGLGTDNPEHIPDSMLF